MCKLASLTSLLLRRRIAASAGDTRSWPGSEAAGVPRRRGDRRCSLGCSTGDDAVAQGGTFEFVAPGGKTDIFYDPPENRGRPGPLAGPELMDPPRRCRSTTSPARSWSSTSGVSGAGRAAPRSPSCRRSTTPPARQGVAFLGIDVRDNNRDAAAGFRHRPQGDVPVDLRPGDAHHDRVRRQVPDHGHPVHRGAGPPAPGGRGVPARTARRGPAAGGGAACGRTGADRHDRVHRDRRRRAAAAGVWRCACWPDWCRSPRHAWCRWCPATCRIWPPSSASERPAGSGRGPHTRGWRVAGSARCSSPGFTAVFLLGTVAVLGMTTTLITNQLVLQRIGGVLTIVMGLVFVGFIPGAAAPGPVHAAAAVDAGRRATARRGVRAGLDAVPGPDADRGDHGRVGHRRRQRGPRCRAGDRLLPGPGNPVRAVGLRLGAARSRAWAGCGATPGPFRSSVACC